MRVSADVEKKVKIDVKDKKILELLSQNARLPIATIAKKVQLQRDTVAYKMKRLETLGVIQAYVTHINFSLIGFHVFHLFLVLEEKNVQMHADCLAYLKKHSHVVSIMEYSDAWDFEIECVARSNTEINGIVTDICQRFSGIILERAVAVSVDEYYSRLFPDDFFKIQEKVKKVVPYEVDEKDIAILKHLALDARASTYDLAKKTGLSPDTIGNRIKQLSAADIISRFSILPNLSLLGYSWYTCALRMNVFDRQDESKFTEFVNKDPYIVRALKIIGPWDILLYAIADKPLHFHRLIKRVKKEFIENLEGYATFIAYKEHVYTTFPSILSKTFKN